jgi:hypothetical protein
MSSTHPKYQPVSNQSTAPHIDQTPHSSPSDPPRSRSRSPRLIAYLLTPLLLCGALLSAICQHYFYAHFNRQQVDQSVLSQVWVIRIGTGLAFLFKATMTAAIGGAFCHSAWFCFQSSSTTLGGLDAIFGVLQNPLNFFNRDMLFNKKILTLFALLAWLMPLSAILSPGSMIGIHHRQNAILTRSHDCSNSFLCNEASACCRLIGHGSWVLCESPGYPVEYPQ